MRPLDTRLFLLTMLPLALAAPAIAQESATRRAVDAFGERIGLEQVGLYGEGNVRGFDLQSSGAYRIEGSYFARHSSISDAALGGVSVRVGASGARLDYPSPSGAVDYRLRDTTGPSNWRVTTGLREYESFVIDASRLWVSEDGVLGLSANVIARPDAEWALGTEGSVYELGVVGRYEPSEAMRIRTVLSVARRLYNGDYGIVLDGATLPKPPLQRQNFSPNWAKLDARDITAGAILDGGSGDLAWVVSAFRASFVPERSDYTLLQVGEDGIGTATMFRTPERDFMSDSLEAKLFRTVSTGTLTHRFGAAARWRGTDAATVGGAPVELGPVDLSLRPGYGDPVETSDDGRRVQDRVDQATLSLMYDLAVSEWLTVRMGAHRSRYEKAVTALDGTHAGRREERWLYNASASWRVAPRTTLFASWVTGLEESGVAPARAVNRNEILPPVEAEQKEVGVRVGLGERMNLTGAAFELSKPTTGFRADGSFGHVGQVTHRGIEGSLAGQLRPGTSIVLGGFWLDAEIEGELVRTAVIGPTPAGVSEFRALASLEQELGFAPGWSADAYVTYDAERWVDARNTVKAPGHPWLNLGVRRRWRVADTDLLMRLVASNVFNRTGWWASANEQIWPAAPRAFRATLTATF